MPGSGVAFVVATPDGAALPVYAFGGPAHAPALLFGHANGLAAGSYAPWLRELAGTLRVFAFDARGHGGARWPAGPLETVFAVDRLADDLALVAATIGARLGGDALNYAGHSLNVAAALRPLAEGGYTLCCPPEVDSAIFQMHRIADTWQRLAQVRTAVHLVAGDPALPGRGWLSACMPDMAALLRARLTTLPGTGHMMIFEQPDACRDLLLPARGEAPRHAP